VTNGVFVGLASDDSYFGFTERAIWGGAALSSIGLVVGTIGGADSSTGKQEIEIPVNFDFSSLRPLARFLRKESRIFCPKPGKLVNV
jgi:hypothetical protein